MNTSTRRPPLVILVGAAGVGKTAIRQPLAGRLGFQSVGPDDFPGRWNEVYPWLDAFPCVLECCQIPRAVRERLDGSEVVIELQAPAGVRRERMQAQGLRVPEITRRLVQAGSIAYGDEVPVSLAVDTSSGDPGELADAIAEHVGALA